MILTPIATNQILNRHVINGVASQTVGMDWFIHSLAPSITTAIRECNININRHQLQQTYKEQKHSEYVLLLDSDVVMQPNTIQLLMDMMISNKDLICASARTKPTKSNHIITACALMRYSCYEVINYLDGLYECQCKKIAKIGTIEYHPDIQLYEIDK